MSDSEAIGALLTLAEIGIGLVGFAGLVLAVTRRQSKMSRGDVIQLRELVRAGLGAVALALLPVGALLVGATGPSLWRWFSGLPTTGRFSRPIGCPTKSRTRFASNIYLRTRRGWAVISMKPT